MLHLHYLYLTVHLSQYCLQKTLSFLCWMYLPCLQINWHTMCRLLLGSFLYFIGLNFFWCQYHTWILVCLFYCLIIIYNIALISVTLDTDLDLHIYSLFYRFFSITVYHRILDIDSCRYCRIFLFIHSLYHRLHLLIPMCLSFLCPCPWHLPICSLCVWVVCFLV